ncbi:MAG: DUF2812 domain-containing protein [Butyricicoccus sp.]|nr:DUF2812 domain-containing protein [Butyricicoccus sp.]
MGKITARFLKYYPADRQAFETWLSDMAARGLHLDEIGRFMARFEKDLPVQDVRFRCAPSPDGCTPDLEARADYQDMGWTYICDTPFTEYLIFRADDPETPELHTDPGTQALTLRRLIRRRLTGLLITLAIVLLTYGTIGYRCLSADAPFYTFASQHVTITVLFTVLLLIAVWESLYSPSSDGLIALLRRRRALQNGEPEDHRAVRRRHPAAGLLSISVFVLIWGGDLVHDLFLPEYHPITDAAELPYIDLGAFEGEPDYTPNSFSRFNAYEKHPTVLLPEHTEVRQQGKVPSRIWTVPCEERTDQTYHPVLNVLRCTTWTEGTAAHIFDEWCNDSLVREFDAAYTPIETACDRAALVQYTSFDGSPYTGLLLQDGKRLLRVSYRGERDLTEHLDTFTALLA